MDVQDEAYTVLRMRIERLEAIVVLLCQEARQGMGQRAIAFDEFIDSRRRDHSGEGAA